MRAERLFLSVRLNVGLGGLAAMYCMDVVPMRHVGMVSRLSHGFPHGDAWPPLCGDARPAHDDGRRRQSGAAVLPLT